MVSLLHCDLLEDRNYLVSLSASSTLSAGPGTYQALTLLLSWFSYTHFPILKCFYFHEADGAWSSCSKEWSDQPDHLDTTAHCGLCPSHGPGWQGVCLESYAVMWQEQPWAGPSLRNGQVALCILYGCIVPVWYRQRRISSSWLSCYKWEIGERRKRYLLCHFGAKLGVCWATRTYASCSDLGLGTEFLTLPERRELERKGWRLILWKAG